MKVNLECYPCFLRIALHSCNLAGADEDCRQRVMGECLDFLKEALNQESPLAVAVHIQEIVKKHTGHEDPYSDSRVACNSEAATWVPMIEEKLKEEKDSLNFALKAAAIGNIMDYGAFASFDLKGLLQTIHDRSFRYSVRKEFEERLEKAGSLAYVTDNAGELLFDRILIKYLIEHYSINKLYIVVRDEAFLNDVCLGDPELDLFSEMKCVSILPLSVLRKRRDPEVWKKVTGSDMVLCKGMANFENYSDRSDFFFLFIAKCEFVARNVQTRTGQKTSIGDWLFCH